MYKYNFISRTPASQAAKSTARHPSSARHGDPRRYLLGPPPVASQTRRRARQSARLDAKPAAPGAPESARLDARFLHQRVCVPLDAAVIPCDVECNDDY